MRLKKRINLKEFFSKFYWNKDYLDLFIKTDSEGLILLRESGIDHKIKLKKINEKDVEVL